MVYVFTANSTAYTLSQIIRDYQGSLPAWYLVKAKRYAVEADACNYLLGKVLLLKAMRMLGYGNISLNDLRFNPFSKPYFNNRVSFNISHSGGYVVCALSETAGVGIDLEEMKSIDVDIFSNCFSAREWSFVKNADDPLPVFYKLWTRKEAVIKADGRGLEIPLCRFEVIEDCVSIDCCNWFIKELPVAEGYIAHVATDRMNDGHFIQRLL